MAPGKKQNMKSVFLVILFAGLLNNARAWQAVTHDFPEPEDTRSKPVLHQSRQTWKTGSVYASNRFPGARLNDFRKVNDSTYRALILPENKPVNKSPWYAFKLWSAKKQTIRLILDYDYADHRYFPKISQNGKDWAPLDSARFSMHNKQDALLRLDLGPDTLWVAAQPVVSSADVADWCVMQSRHPDVRQEIFGKSQLGRPLRLLDIGQEPATQKRVVALLCRQHPPEVTGWFALQHFIDELLSDSELALAFRQQYRVLVFPLVNPDGVDLGFWRHNAGGVDLNRDWACYRQPETRLVANKIVHEVQKHRSTLVLGFDFHSTFEDVFYTGDETENPPVLPGFKDAWLSGMKTALPGFEFEEDAAPEGKPVSKSWFLAQFCATGVTYEIGDNTPPEMIEQKGRVSARVMMELLLSAR